MIEAVTLGVTVLVAYFGLKISNAVKDVRLEQSKVKEDLVAKQVEIKDELVAKQNEMRQDIDKKHAENTMASAVHSASDEAKFEAISRTLTRMDGKLDMMNSKS